jgi:DNA-binding CsgD family transcriptional regulator
VRDVALTEADQTALRFVLAAEPLAGHPLPRCDVLERLATLVRCDTIGAAASDRDGYIVDHVELPHGRGPTPGAVVFRIGMVHCNKVSGYAGLIHADGLSDFLAMGFRNGRDGVVQVRWERWTGQFSDRDVAVLTMIEPAVGRLVRDGAGPALPASLTVQERRTLMLVAAGCSNSQIARRMGVATSTVRKHLEHAYRKLGVTNRLAAAVAFRGEQLAAHPYDRLAARD